jgi:hypothetical protein
LIIPMIMAPPRRITFAILPYYDFTALRLVKVTAPVIVLVVVENGSPKREEASEAGRFSAAAVAP